MVPRHRLLLPTGSRGCPCISSALSQHCRWSLFPSNANQHSTASCSLSTLSTSQSVSSSLSFVCWRRSLLLRTASVVLCTNFSSRARRIRATSTQMRLSQLPLGVGEVAVIGDVGENLGLKEKAELVTQQFGDLGEGKPDQDQNEDTVVIPSDRDIKPGLRRLAGSNIFVGASIGPIRIKNAEFIKSSPKVAECPRDGLPEFAVVGRSNVGKSSLVNTLVKRKDLALTSKKPGKTQLINHFRIDNNWYLVDLPGYGFAKAPKVIRSDWNAFTKDYFLNRETLLCVLLLVDASIPPQQIDLDCADWLGRNNIPVTVVFTKCDRKKKNKNGGRKPEVNIQEFETKLKEYFDEVPPWVMTSSATGQGKEELLTHLGNLRKYWKS